MSGITSKNAIEWGRFVIMSSIQAMETFQVDELKVQVYSDRDSLGLAACEQAVQHIKQLMTQKNLIRIVFGAAPSQNEFLQALSCAVEIDWSRIIVFHMDEYIG